MIGCTVRGDRAYERAKYREEAVVFAQLSRALTLAAEGRQEVSAVRRYAEFVPKLLLNALEWRRQCANKKPWDDRRGGSILEAPQAYQFVRQVADRMQVPNSELHAQYWEFLGQMRTMLERIAHNRGPKNLTKPTRVFFERVAEWCIQAAHVRALQAENLDRLLDNDD